MRWPAHSAYTVDHPRDRPAEPTHGGTDHAGVYSYRARRPQGDHRRGGAAARHQRVRRARHPQHAGGAAQALRALPRPSRAAHLLRGRADRLRHPPAAQLAGRPLRGDRALADPQAQRGARQDRPRRCAQPGPPAPRRRAHRGPRALARRGGAARPRARARGPQERPPHRAPADPQLPAALRASATPCRAARWSFRFEVWLRALSFEEPAAQAAFEHLVGAYFCEGRAARRDRAPDRGAGHARAAGRARWRACAPSAASTRSPR